MPNKKTKKKPTTGTVSLSDRTLLANKTFLMIVAVIVVILAVYFGVKGLNAISEKRHLNWASQRLDYVQSRLDKVTGAKVSVERSKACSYGEQANDFDKGKLFCGVILHGTYFAQNNESVDTSASGVLNLLSTPKVFGGGTMGTQIAYDTSYSIPDQDLLCQIIINTPRSNNQSTQSYQVEIKIICKLQASWHYYPTDNNSGV